MCQLIRRPRTSRPLYEPRQITPRSIIDAASEPASGLVKPKHGISRPSARRGSQYCCCSFVPKRISNSPGPSELGTMTVTAVATERVEIFLITSECANAENPNPPYSFGMIIPKKRFALMKSQTSGGRSRNSQLMRQSSSRPQSCSTVLEEKPAPPRTASQQAYQGVSTSPDCR